MPVETRILDALEDVKCRWCGRFVKIGKGETLGYWSQGKFFLICPKCEPKDEVKEAIKDKKQERV